MNIIKAMRINSGISLEELAQRIDIPVDDLERIESLDNDSDELALLIMSRTAIATGADIDAVMRMAGMDLDMKKAS